MIKDFNQQMELDICLIYMLMRSFCDKWHKTKMNKIIFSQHTHIKFPNLRGETNSGFSFVFNII